MRPLTLKDISFDLPPHLIAQRPGDRRGEDRLLVLSTRTGRRRHLRFPEFPGLLDPGTVCIVNDSRVRKARVPLRDGKGRELWVLFTASNDPEHATWSVLLNKAGRRRRGEVLEAPDGRTFTLEGRLDNQWIGRFSEPVDESFFEAHGHVPLPPYVKRSDEPEDEERYQTVYARVPGSAAAPTAGLHFTQEILQEMERLGIELHPVTLHVGLGTFLPVRAERVLEHRMHTEEYEVPERTALALNRAREEGRPILAVGTTSLRTLESAVRPDGRFEPSRGATDLYIHPGYAFRVTRFLLTNFHTPGSTLILLVAALSGLDLLMETYREAIRMEYRFFSYGDAMLLDPR